MPGLNRKPPKRKTVDQKQSNEVVERSQARSVDKKARVSLPKDFAGCTVLVERIGGSELRIRKAMVVPEVLGLPADVWPKPLSERDWAAVQNALRDPPPPNAALKRALKLAGKPFRIKPK